MNDFKGFTRILAVDCQAPSLADKPELAPCIEFRDLHENGNGDIRLLEHPSLKDVHSMIEEFTPDVVYCYGGIVPYDNCLHGQHKSLSFPDIHTEVNADSLADACRGSKISILYIDAPLEPKQVEELRKKDCFVHLVYWSKECETSAVVCAQFAHCFFAMLRIKGVEFRETFALATRSVHLHCESVRKEKPNVQMLPNYVSPYEPELPLSNSVPIESSSDIQFIGNENIPDVENWEEVLLLAPKAELRMLICGDSSTIEVARLSSLGEALRALLVIEMRTLTVTEVHPCEPVPSNLSPSSLAKKCKIKSASGIDTCVVLGGPPSVLSKRQLVQHALRQTLTVDSLCVQFRLPSPVLPPTIARSSAFVAGGAPVVDALVHTSVWAVDVLRGLALNKAYRGLISFGIAGIGGNGLVTFQGRDTVRYNTIITGRQLDALVPYSIEPESNLDEKLLSHPLTNIKAETPAYTPNGGSEVDLIEGIDNEYDFNMEAEAEYDDVPKVGTEQMYMPMPTLPEIDFQSNRPLLSRCSEAEFYSDLVSFLQKRGGKALDAMKFPEAVLNGVQLDLFNLYKEVVSRGGFRVGNGINWKGQVFPKMKNWTAHHRMTGVGNALKRHYQAYLLEYEMFHSEDVTGDGCWLCRSNEENGADWICCDHCERWVHFACDKRPFLGAFKDYATGNGRTYHCPRCSETIKRQKTNC